MTVHYHGTPITPRSVLDSLAGRSFCVSFARPDNVEHCHRIGQAVMLDNGAYSVWSKGAEIAWDDWAAWASRWLDWPTTWAILPDSITGGEAENNELLEQYAHVAGERGVPVWHLHESLDRLADLVARFDRVAFGSSGAYRVIGTPAWERRVSEAFDDLAGPDGRVPWVHMLRGMGLAGDRFPFASLDSTDIARNHNRPQNIAARMAERWDSMQCPPLWRPVDQLTLEAS